MMEADANTAADADEHQRMLSLLISMQASWMALSIRGSKPTRIFKRAFCHVKIYQDYFLTTQHMVWFHFSIRMKKYVLMPIVCGLRDYDDYFQVKQDCTGLAWFSSI